MAYKSLKIIINAVDNASSKIRGIADKADKNFNKLRGAATVAVGGLVAVSGAIGVAVNAYSKQENAENALASVLQSHGDAVNTLLPKYKDMAAAIQQQTIMGDESVIAMMAQIRNLGVMPDKMEAATKGAIGLSQALGLDANSAARYTALALQGETTILQRYVPALRTAKTAAEKQAIVQDLMSKGYEQAQAKTITFSGKLIQLKNRIGDNIEKIGKGFIPILLKIGKVVEKIVTKLEKIDFASIIKSEWFQTAALAAGSLAVGIIAVTAALKGFSIAMNAIALMSNPFAWIGLAIGAAIFLFIKFKTEIVEYTKAAMASAAEYIRAFGKTIEIIFKNFPELVTVSFHNIIEIIKASINASIIIIKAIGKTFEIIFKNFPEIIDVAFHNALGLIRGYTQSIIEIANRLANVFKLAGKIIFSALKGDFSGVKSAWKDLTSVVTDNWDDTFEKIKKAADLKAFPATDELKNVWSDAGKKAGQAYKNMQLQEFSSTEKIIGLFYEAGKKSQLAFEKARDNIAAEKAAARKESEKPSEIERPKPAGIDFGDMGGQEAIEKTKENLSIRYAAITQYYAGALDSLNIFNENVYNADITALQKKEALMLEETDFISMTEQQRTELEALEAEKRVKIKEKEAARKQKISDTYIKLVSGASKAFFKDGKAGLKDFAAATIQATAEMVAGVLRAKGKEWAIKAIGAAAEMNWISAAGYAAAATAAGVAAGFVSAKGEQAAEAVKGEPTQKPTPVTVTEGETPLETTASAGTTVSRETRPININNYITFNGVISDDEELWESIVEDRINPVLERNAELAFA